MAPALPPTVHHFPQITLNSNCPNITIRERGKQQSSSFNYKETFLFLSYFNRPFLSSPGPLFQNEGRCSAFDMEIIFHSHANKTHFHRKGCAPSLILKVRVFGTRKWPILESFSTQTA